MALEQVDGNGFDAKVKNDPGVVVVDFYGKECAPCKKLLPIVEEVAGEFSGKVKFVKCDIEEAEDVAVGYEVYAVPTLVFFKGGKPVVRITGFQNKERITAQIKPHLS